MNYSQIDASCLPLEQKHNNDARSVLFSVTHHFGKCELFALNVPFHLSYSIVGTLHGWQWDIINVRLTRLEWMQISVTPPNMVIVRRNSMAHAPYPSCTFVDSWWLMLETPINWHILSLLYCKISPVLRFFLRFLPWNSMQVGCLVSCIQHLIKPNKDGKLQIKQWDIMVYAQCCFGHWQLDQSFFDAWGIATHSKFWCSDLIRFHDRERNSSPFVMRSFDMSCSCWGWWLHQDWVVWCDIESHRDQHRLIRSQYATAFRFAVNYMGEIWG